MFFLCVIEDDYYDDDEEDDPDALKDPIYQIDLQVHSFWILFVLTTMILVKDKTRVRKMSM